MIPEPQTDRWAVVTGASSGIGEQLARQLAARGHDVVLVARRRELLEAVAVDLETLGVRTKVLVADLGDAAARAGLIAELQALDVSVLCLNAGLGTFAELATSDFAVDAQQVQVNTVAVAELTYALVPGMVQRSQAGGGGGAVLMTGSLAGVQPLPGAGTYAATKAFVNSLAESLHTELHGTGVSCTLLAPGPVKTGFFKDGQLRVSERLINLFFLRADRVAAAALEGLEQDRRRVVPGAFAKVLLVGSAITPKFLALPVIWRGLRLLH